MTNKANQRAKLTKSTIIDARSLAHSHRKLAEMLKQGMTVLDIGCGTGAITRGIVEIVGPAGKVVGIDNNPQLIQQAREKYGGVAGLNFEVGDVYNLPFYDEFDIVTSARVLQWLADPAKAVQNMVKAAKRDGIILVLDYNHEKIAWEPQVPLSMERFYKAFLRWRSDAGMDNAIADHLTTIFKEAGLTDISDSPQHETTHRTDEDFQTHISIWAGVAKYRGAQMREDGFISEAERADAEDEFRRWIAERAESQTMYLLAVQGKKTV